MRSRPTSPLLLATLATLASAVVCVAGRARASEDDPAHTPHGPYAVRSAFDGPVAAPSTPPTERRWYGGETLLADAAGFATMTGGLFGGSGTVMLAGAGVYTVGGGIVHAAHGRYGVAVADALLHGGALAGGGFLGAMVGSGGGCHGGDHEGGCLSAVVIGGLLGALVSAAVATTIDATTLAYEDVPAAPRPYAAPYVGYVPAAGGKPGSWTLGVSGAF